MSDNFYDFDKDDMFDEIYLKKSPTPPKKKEFEIKIPMPQSGLKSTIEPKVSEKKSENKPAPRVPKRKKLSPTALTLIIIGIAVSSILTFLLTFAGTIFSWNYLPSFEKPSEENSVVEDAKQIQEVIEISEDGNTVEVVPMYRDTDGDDAPPSNSNENTEEKDTDDTDSQNEESVNEDTDNSSLDSEENNATPEDEIMIIE